MIGYIIGTLEYKAEDTILLQNNGIGYEIRIPLSVLSSLPGIGEEVKIYTYLYVREDAMLLYGFLSDEDLSIFKLLLTVSGIGPKSALGILSAITPDELRYAIIENDDTTIASAPGIGKKTAQRVIIDLKDKLKLKDYTRAVSQEIGSEVSTAKGIKSEAIQALISLGYSQNEAVKAMREITVYDKVEDVIKEALKGLNRL